MPFIDDVLSGISAALQSFKDSRAAREHGTRLDVYHTEEQSMMSPIFLNMRSLVSKASEIPRRGTLEYSNWTDTLWKEEPILSGAVYSMVAKVQALTFRVEGGRNNAGRVARMCARSRYMNGSNWVGFIGGGGIDFYTKDNGVWWDVTRDGDSQWGMMSDLALIDTRCCYPTGSAEFPMYYQSMLVNDSHWYKPGEFIHFASMALPNELELGMGMCAVSRAARAAKLLMALHDYDAEKLRNLPPEGIATVTGLTEREFRQAIQLWLSERQKNNSLTFPQVLWLIGSNPGAEVKVNIESFSRIPESFDRDTVVQQYVNTLALCFGVDTREFWAISTAALGTASEAEVQALKAKGKGGGEFITMVEQHINAELPEDVVFRFDTQDMEEDATAAATAAAWVDAYIDLVYPPGNAIYEPILDANTFKRILADKGALPEWAAAGPKTIVTSTEIHKEGVPLEDIVRIVYDAGLLKEHTLIDLTTIPSRRKEVPSAPVLPALPATTSQIKGKPINDSEVDRGANVTSKSLRGVFQWWSEVPELKGLVPEAGEHASPS